MHYDIFNGDADGILALIQLRLSEPKTSTLITGVKRDISLLQRVPIDSVTSATVLDVSMEKNTEALNNLLNQQIPVMYVDHHRSGDIPSSPCLNAIINTAPDVCTSLLVNDYLKGKHNLWAIAAAFGDNLKAVAQRHCHLNGLSGQLTNNLEALGTYVNYNGYGRDIDDLHYHPGNLYEKLKSYETPENLFAEKSSLFFDLETSYQQDMTKADSAEVLFDSDVCKVIALEDASWSRRVSGVYGNDLANRSPNKAHGVLTKNLDGSYTVSVRAPLNNKQGADEICVQFPSGGGRAAAAGINALPEEQVETFISSLFNFYKT
ncbi:DHH family phosphoesterase [Thalassomonas sp. M1454]|uniref:DHH family phosphoesterase n=1 Tax=Thalassomonas sp. M1454 TaxID=2594477 RepID=UPI00117F9ABF|nr:DHH family phosphoesterase [Thalassomonas sp. M1454]TRX57396.1 DHH family phosphoesterase [Thalassomonas sp. M1454]